MDQVYFLVFTGLDAEGCIINGREALQAYCDSLTEEQAAGYQLLEFTEEFLPLILKNCPKARHFIF